MPFYKFHGINVEKNRPILIFWGVKKNCTADSSTQTLEPDSSGIKPQVNSPVPRGGRRPPRQLFREREKCPSDAPSCASEAVVDGTTSQDGQYPLTGLFWDEAWKFLPSPV